MALASCGGGGSSDPEQPSAPPQQRTDRPYFGYYGNSPGQTAATVGHTSICGAPPWEQSAHFTYIQECVGHGLPVIVDVTYVLFQQVNNSTPGYVYFGSERAKINLREYLARLQALGLLDHVKVVYPIDEPDLNVIAPDMCRVTADIRSVLAEFHVSPVLAVIYNGEHGTPGAECFDWIGRDSYPHGPQSLPLLPGQRLLIVAGGADPFRESVAPYEAYANSHPEVVAVIAFAYFDYSGGLGIAHNGLLESYKAAGCRITNKCKE